jgi:iron(III) transport system substrate-binding protein
MHKHRTFYALAACGLVSALATACSGAGSAAGGNAVNTAAPTGLASASAASTAQASAMSSICKTGAAEGSVNYWTEQDPSVFAKEDAPFEAQYHIKVNVTMLQPQDQVTRSLTEIHAHHALTADVLAPDPESALPLFQAGDVQSVDLSKYGINPDLAVTVDNTTVYVTQRDFHGVAYNTSDYKASDIPDTWTGLVDSQLAGKISVDPRGKWIAPVVTAPGWTQASTVAWYKKLLATDKPQIINGVTDSLTQVASGQTPITTSARNAEVAQEAANGAPVAIKYMNVIPVDEVVGTQLKNDPHPAAATCFLAWLAGPQAQAQQFKYEFKTNALKPAGAPANAVYSNDLNEANVTLISNTEKQMSALTQS